MDNANRVVKEPRAKWTRFHDGILVNSIVEQINNGRTTQNGFTKAAWAQILTEFNNNTRCAYTLDQVKNRLSLLKKEYRTVKSLIGLSGFGWDSTLQIVTAEDIVWQDYLKEHPDAKEFRTQGFPIYDQMTIICGDLTADGREAASPVFAAAEYMRESQPPAQVNPTFELVCPDEQSTGEIRDTPPAANRRSSAAPSSSRSRVRNRGRSEDVASAIFDLADATRELKSPKLDDCPYSLTKCINALMEIEGLSQDTYLKACLKMKDQGNREIFMAMRSDLRLPFLEYLISRDM